MSAAAVVDSCPACAAPVEVPTGHEGDLDCPECGACFTPEPPGHHAPTPQELAETVGDRPWSELRGPWMVVLGALLLIGGGVAAGLGHLVHPLVAGALGIGAMLVGHGAYMALRRSS